MTVLTLRSPVQGVVIALNVAVGDAVAAGQAVVIVESMKMEVPIEAGQPGRVRALPVAVGDTVG